MSLTTKLMYVYFSHFVFFTFSNISKTLILCSIKQKPRTQPNEFTVHSVRNTDNEGDRFGFCFYSDQYDQRIPSLTFLLLDVKQTPLPDLNHKRLYHLFSFKTVMIMNCWEWPASQVCRSVWLGIDIETQWADEETIKDTQVFFLDTVIVKRNSELKTTNPV